jgi:hypothetical protein
VTADGRVLSNRPERKPFGLTLRCGCEVTVDGETTRVVQRCEKESLERDLEDAYKTIRALVGEPIEGCPALDCPYERVVQRAEA